jgi:hypothetical protein
MKDESCHFGTDFGTSFNRRTSKTWVFMANHMEEEMVKDNVATL